VVLKILSYAQMVSSQIKIVAINLKITVLKGVVIAINSMLGGVPVPTAWRVLGLRIEERPPAMEVSCEYNE
jgi:hypothetical protein